MEYEDRIVEAIEEGKIVRVYESYAKREGLPVLRKPNIGQIQKTYASLPPGLKKIQKQEETPIMEKMRKAPSWEEKQIISDLIDNFHWHINRARRNKGLTRKQFAKLINIPESSLEMIEYRRLPSNNFILIQKIEEVLGINLRKNKISIEQARIAPEKNTKIKEKDKRKITNPLFGSDIEILED